MHISMIVILNKKTRRTSPGKTKIGRFILRTKLFLKGLGGSCSSGPVHLRSLNHSERMLRKSKVLVIF